MKGGLPVFSPQHGGGPESGRSSHDQCMVIPAARRAATAFAKSFQKKERSWFVTSQIPTDITVQIQDITFHFHKKQYPLLSRSGYMARLNPPVPTITSTTTFNPDIKIDNFPGGADTFELVLKFCYGLAVDLTAATIAPLRCAAEFLEMTEDLEEGNLIYKTESFITFVVLTSWRNSITVLKSCERLLPYAENLQIIRRCSESIAWNVAGDTATASTTSTAHSDDASWWFEDASVLKINHFVRILTVIRSKGVAAQTIGDCIEYYATRWLPGYEGMNCCEARGELQVSISSGWRRENIGEKNKEERMIIESLVSILPLEKEAVSCGFLLWLLKMGMVYYATVALLSELEMRIGIVLEDATVNDLLIPNYPAIDEVTSIDYSAEESTLHDIDTVQRIVEYFLMYEQQQQQQPNSSKMRVGKLLDSYLAEIATDPNLSPTKFQVLTEVLPENARTSDDGLYRAIDTYLKAHPALTEHERRRVCKAMHCEKLSLDACLHASHNERLPLRTVLQVLFTEQIKMRQSMQRRDRVTQDDDSDQGSSRSTTKQQVKALKAEVERMKAKVEDLQRDYSELHQEFDRLGKHRKSTTLWSSGWKKIRNSALFHRRRDDNNLAEQAQEEHAETSQRTRRASIA